MLAGLQVYDERGRIILDGTTKTALFIYNWNTNKISDTLELKFDYNLTPFAFLESGMFPYSFRKENGSITLTLNNGYLIVKIHNNHEQRNLSVIIGGY